MRRFQKRPVEPEKIEQILRAAMAAPSAGNQQPWEFYVVTDKAKLAALSKVHQYAGMVKDAPAAIVSAYRKECWMPVYAQIDLSIAMENLWLETDAQGLGGVWLLVGPVKDRAAYVDKVLGIGEDLHAFALVALGYPAEGHPQKDRFDPARIHEC